MVINQAVFFSLVDKMPIISIRGVEKSFGSNIVLKKIDLKIKKGQLIGIKGESGIGKTTLLKILAGYSDLDRGEITYKFKSKRYRLREAKQCQDFHNQIGFSCQEGSFYEELDVYENLDFYRTMHNLKQKDTSRKIKRILSLVNLTDKEGVLTKNLSAGMQKRLDIACALIHEPKVIFFDEPTAHLDKNNQKEIWNLIKKINIQGITAIVTSHFPKDLKKYCNEVYEIKKGGSLI